MRTIRLGVDVGGTFTKAVAVGNNADGHSLLAQAIVPTTHTASEGVALGVVQALQALLDHPDVPAADVTLVAHSTTQAVNALLEGDTATVGIVGMGGGRDGADALRRTQVENIAVAPGKPLRTHHVFIDTSAGMTRSAAEQAVDRLIGLGAQAIVASGAFSVDEPEYELLVLDVAADRGVPSIAGHQLSGVYGLEIRTLTAAINASLAPQMLQTAELVEQSLRRAGIDAPLMVMRGDGGLTDLATLHRRPILTLFSGPAASLAGALLSGGVANGAFLEVGGTSSNLGIVRGGQPETRYVWVMNHPTCVRSLDVRVQGVAGGSLARIGRRKIVDVGPRSAHIAGLPYASLSPELADIPAAGLSLEVIAPRPGDPADYAVVQAADGRRWALTVTCAANALGKVAADVYAAGSSAAALRGFEILGQTLRCTGQEAAQQMLDLAAERVAAAVKEMSGEYKLRRGAFQLIGGGGGAGALIPAVAERLHIPYRLVEHAPVISSLGDALASVREEVERAIGDASVAESLAQEAESAAIRAGAAPESVQV
ncbi:MAG: hydantoinase/oxoprolinase family protein, partial [Caldilineaceae bacterium]